MRLVAFSLAAVLACTRVEAPAPAPPLAVEAAGCAVLREGPICELSADHRLRRLRLWIDGPATGSLRARTDRGPLPLGTGVPADTGVRYEVTLPPSATWLDVEDVADGVRRSWRLSLQAGRASPVLEQASRLGSQPRTDEAEALLRGALATLNAEDRGRAQAMLAKLALQRGQLPAAIAGLDQARQAARRSGRLSDWLGDTEVLIFVYTFQQHDLARAQRLIDEVTRVPALPTIGRARLAAMSARLAEEAGDLRGAVVAMRTAENLDRRMGEARFARYERGEIARLLTLIGRADEAHPIVRELVEHQARNAEDEAPCNVAASRHNLAWVSAMVERQRRDEAGIGALEAPGADGETARLFAAARLAYRDCPNPHLYQHLLIDEALFALDTSDTAGARARRDQLQRLVSAQVPTAATSIWLQLIEGRLWLGDRRPRLAAGAFARAAGLARAASLAERELDAQTGLGQALAALGRHRDAARHLADAERILDRLFATVPLAEGRDVYLASRDHNARQLVEILVKLGRPADALAAARRARGRLLRATAFAERVANLGEADRARWLAAIGRYRQARARIDEQATEDWKLSAVALAEAHERRGSLVAEQAAALDQAYRVLNGRPRVEFEPWTPLRSRTSPGRGGGAVVPRDQRVARVRGSPLQPGDPAGRRCKNIRRGRAGGGGPALTGRHRQRSGRRRSGATAAARATRGG